MDRLFDRVMVRKPSLNYKNCVSSNPLHSTIDVTLALKQHEEYVKILRENGIEVIEFPPLDDHPDSVFVQDAAIVGESSRKALISRFGEPSRRGEEKNIMEYLEGEGYETVRIEPPGTLEGGDVLITDAGKIFVGNSPRTNKAGIQQLAQIFPDMEVVEIKIEKIFHLLSGVNYLGNGRMAVSPSVLNVEYFRGFELVEIPPDELYANNLLYMGKDRVLIPAGYPETRKILERNGFEPVEAELSEFWKGDGGVTCLNSPFYKSL